jgi:hypothetical protein
VPTLILSNKTAHLSSNLSGFFSKIKLIKAALLTAVVMKELGGEKTASHTGVPDHNGRRKRTPSTRHWK